MKLVRKVIIVISEGKTDFSEGVFQKIFVHSTQPCSALTLLVRNLLV